ENPPRTSVIFHFIGEQGSADPDDPVVFTRGILHWVIFASIFFKNNNSPDKMKLLEQMTINCKGKLIDLSVPKVMGILNVTPDSFFDGGTSSGRDAIVARADEILGEGADFIDIGGSSSRPGASAVPESEELSRVVDAARTVVDAFPDA